MRRLTAFFYGLSSLLSLFTILDKPTTHNPQVDRDMLSNDWKKVGGYIHQSMNKIGEAYGSK